MGFVLHPDTDLSTTVNITLINEDCQLAPGQSKTTIDANTNGDLDGDGHAGTQADAAKLCDPGPSQAMRQLVGGLYPDRIVVFVRKRSRDMKWVADAGPQHWLLDTGAYGASSANSFSVRMPSGSGGNLFAHEVGHYLHLGHTFGKKAKTVAHATSLVTEWMKKIVAGGVSPSAPTPPASIEEGKMQLQLALRHSHAQMFAKGHTINWSILKDVYFHENSTRRGTVVRDGVRVDLAAEKTAIEELLAVDEEQ